MTNLPIAIGEELHIVVIDSAGASKPVHEQRRIPLQVLVQVVHLAPVDIKLGNKAHVLCDCSSNLEVAPLLEKTCNVLTIQIIASLYIVGECSIDRKAIGLVPACKSFQFLKLFCGLCSFFLLAC